MGNVRVIVEKILFDPNVGASVMLLKEDDGERRLPVWIGPSEALSIAMALEKVTFKRPMTHDLLNSILGRLDVEIDWVKITDFQEGTYFALMKLIVSGDTVQVDARPSDAIAMATRTNSPIFVAEQVFVDTMEIGRKTLEDIEGFEESILEDLPNDVYGKYKM
ncbi:MAG: bifunctional nuclease family protein [Proteobacteria bacterium]|nr:bifunctional nuclease family protein [Pseudomonadota bacterium]